MRIDKYIADTSALSRREAHIAIKRGQVRIDEEVIDNISIKIEPEQDVYVNDIKLRKPGPVYLMLHKPKGYVCANSDSDHQTVLELIDEPCNPPLQICGRLDVDTTGLVLLTNDGKWNHRVTSPKKALGKCYYVHLKHELSDDDIKTLCAGVRLNGETKDTAPATIKRLYANEVLITITEGRYHQVKRMFAAIGNRVEELHRREVAGIELGELSEGEYRTLNPEEIAKI